MVPRALLEAAVGGALVGWHGAVAALSLAAWSADLSALLVGGASVRPAARFAGEATEGDEELALASVAPVVRLEAPWSAARSPGLRERSSAVPWAPEPVPVPAISSRKVADAAGRWMWAWLSVVLLALLQAPVR